MWVHIPVVLHRDLTWVSFRHVTSRDVNRIRGCHLTVSLEPSAILRYVILKPLDSYWAKTPAQQKKTFFIDKNYSHSCFNCRLAELVDWMSSFVSLAQRPKTCSGIRTAVREASYIWETYCRYRDGPPCVLSQTSLGVRSADANQGYITTINYTGLKFRCV